MAQCFKFAKEGTIIQLPEPDDKGKIPSMKFTNFKNKLERPYIVYADMESTLVKTRIFMSMCLILVVFISFVHMILLKMYSGML